MICTSCMTQNLWFYFAVCFTLFLITTYIMVRLGRHFCIHKAGADVPFSIMDLMMPLSERELVNMCLTMPESSKTAVRRQLTVDYLYMFGVYPGVALLCGIAANKMEHIGKWFFWILAAAQLLPWLFDILENIYLARKLRNPVVDEQHPQRFARYIWQVKAKFIIGFAGAICAVFALLYYWLTADFKPDTPWYLLFMLVELILFVVITNLKPKKKEVLP